NPRGLTKTGIDWLAVSRVPARQAGGGNPRVLTCAHAARGPVATRSPGSHPRLTHTQSATPRYPRVHTRGSLTGGFTPTARRRPSGIRPGRVPAVQVSESEVEDLLLDVFGLAGVDCLAQLLDEELEKLGPGALERLAKRFGRDRRAGLLA